MLHRLFLNIKIWNYSIMVTFYLPSLLFEFHCITQCVLNNKKKKCCPWKQSTVFLFIKMEIKHALHFYFPFSKRTLSMHRTLKSDLGTDKSNQLFKTVDLGKFDNGNQLEALNTKIMPRLTKITPYIYSSLQLKIEWIVSRILEKTKQFKLRNHY